MQKQVSIGKHVKPKLFKSTSAADVAYICTQELQEMLEVNAKSHECMYLETLYKVL